MSQLTIMMLFLVYWMFVKRESSSSRVYEGIHVNPIPHSEVNARRSVRTRIILSFISLFNPIPTPPY